MFGGCHHDRVLAFSSGMNSATDEFDYDIVVIGGGSGGYAAARTTAAAGLKTAVIEGGDEVGGLCILRGCMPTKALLYAAEVMHLARRAATWGIEIPEAGFDFGKVMERKNAMISEFAEYRREQLSDGRFDFIRAHATFEEPHTLALSDGRRVSARHFIIGTGSKIAPAPLPDLVETGYITSDDALQLNELPESIIVLGGGPIALEFAQFFARFGSRVTVIQRSGQILTSFDKDAAESLTQAFVGEGIEVLAGTRIDSVTRDGGKKVIHFDHQGEQKRVAADEIFFALGRAPNTDSLQLDRAGVRLDARGRIETQATMQTSAPHIYAVGDCAGPHEIVHIAIQQGEIAAHNISAPDMPREISYRVLSNIVFTDPQVASVGLTESQAREQGIPFLAASYPFEDHGKSLIMDAKEGFVKLLAHRENGEIIGGSCVGPVGGELIHEIIVAMQARMTVHQLAETPHYHPTLAEIWTYPAEELADQIVCI